MMRIILLAIALSVSPIAESRDAVLTWPLIDFAACDKPLWPKESLRKEETGIVSMAFRVTATGRVEEAVVVGSSGYPALDRTAIEAISKCPFRPGEVSGAPSALWTLMIYHWTIEDTDGTNKALWRAFVDADKGDVAAEFTLSNFGLQRNGKPMSVVERIEWMRKAAKGGHAIAQFMLASAYESGRAIEHNEDEAIRWYLQAASQGNVVAIEKLRLQWPKIYSVEFPSK
jgi:TonB family protein